MFKLASYKERTILKREFNKWGIFDIYKNLEIVIKVFEKKSLSKHVEDKVLLEDNNNNLKRRNENISIDELKKTNNDCNIYLCSNKEQKDLAIKLQPLHTGIMIGQIKNKKFIPNLNFAEIIITYNPTLNYPYAILEDKGANLVLYGRDIMGKSILEYYNQIKENQLLIILDQKKEVIGIGRSRYDNKLITQMDKITIDNIQDIGTHYLKYENKHYLKNIKDS
jgi:60S ribosome subunit biogenesis protein NIP7